MQKGFTLIELLVVVLIIGILAAIALPQYQKAVEKSRAAEAIEFLSAVGRAENIYQLSNGSYTDELEDLDLEFPQLQNFDIGYVGATDAYGAYGIMPASFYITLDRNGGAYSYSLVLGTSKHGTYGVCTGDEAICKAIGGGKYCNNVDDYSPWCHTDCFIAMVPNYTAHWFSAGDSCMF